MKLLLIAFVSGLFIMVTFGVIWVYWNKGKSFSIDREKGSSFECGFDPTLSSRLPFSLRFFLLLVFFLIFDIELMLLIQLPLLFLPFFFKKSLLFLKFFFVLFLGIFEEWRRGSLDWKA